MVSGERHALSREPNRRLTRSTRTVASQPSLWRTREVPGILALCHRSTEPTAGTLHTHQNARVSLLVQGAIEEVTDTKKRIACGPCSITFTPPGYEHGHVVQPGTLTLCADYLPEAVSRFATGSDLLQRPAIFRSGPVVSVGLRIHREFFSEGTISDIVLESLFLELFGEMARHGRIDHEKGVPAWLKQARELIHDCIDEDLSVDAVAKEIAVDVSHLIRTFRRFYGQTPGEYLRELRLQRAVRHLASTQDPIGEIASRAGYSDNSHFSREFRRAIGMTPIEYRRALSR